jgi:exodeoxyribonuclease VII small subunit
MNFEEKMKRLEEIAGVIREGSIDFSRQIELFREGKALAEELEKELERAEQIIEEISPQDQGEN